MPARPLRWIEIRYPAAETRWFGLQFRWLARFVAISMAGALLAKRVLRVSL